MHCKKGRGGEVEFGLNAERERERQGEILTLIFRKNKLTSKFSQISITMNLLKCVDIK